MAESTMNALCYDSPRSFKVQKVPVPQISDDEVLLKVTACGVCGTDAHIHDGEFIAKFPLIPGHEIVGIVHAVGRNVAGFAGGDRVVADPGVTCTECFFCRRGRHLMCENFDGRGVTSPGGFADYVAFPQNKLYKIEHMADEEAIMTEPAACAIHGMDMLGAPVGCDALVIGAGPTGLVLAQLLRLNGAKHVVVAANKGVKTQIAKELDVGEVIELDRADAKAQWAQIAKEWPHGFDVVIEATGVEAIASDAINYVRRGGKLLIYGVYEDKARINWAPSKIFGDEITILGSFAQTHCFPRAVAYLDSGKVNVKGMVTDVYKIDQYQEALDKMTSRKAMKIMIKP